MKPNQTDLVDEYLREVELRLSGLPLLQRRELLADLAAHIATERTERDVRSEGELIEILERLGSPEVVAVAAYEEAGAPRTAATAPPPPFAAMPPPGAQPPPFAPTKLKRPKVGLVILAVVAVLAVLFFFCGFVALARSSEAPQPAEATVAPAAPTPPSPTP